MREYLRLKSWLILIVMLFLGISISFLIVIFEFRDNIKITLAGSGDNVTGYAWSESIGWISFNCSDDNSCGTVDYGVNINPSTGNISGYAWSSNIGWISFNRKTCNGGERVGRHCEINNDCVGGYQCRDDAPGTTGAPPTDPFLSSADVIANYNSSTEEVTGWAKILALGDDGWISFNTDGVPDYGVSIDSSTSEFSGWAWNGSDTDGVGIGWISFNCLDTSSCAIIDYKVIADINTLPAAINLSAPNWEYEDACNLYARQAFLRWEFSDPDVGAEQSAYQVILNDNNNINNPLIDIGKTVGDASQYSATSTLLAYDKTYYWWVKVWDNNDTSSEFTAGPSFTTYEHELPDTDFSYFPAYPSQGEEVQFTDTSIVYGGTSITDWLWSGDSVTISPSATTTNPIMTFSSGGNKTVTLEATASDGYYCSKSKNINVNVSLPSWQEVKPR